MDEILENMKMFIEAINKHSKSMAKHAQDLAFLLNSIEKEVKELKGLAVTTDEEPLCVRDPRNNPQEGDVLWNTEGTREIHIDRVDTKEVAFRVTDGCGGLVRASRVPLASWREVAPSICENFNRYYKKIWSDRE
jgi:hypothetical protein